MAIPPIYVSHLFPALDQKLVELLRSLTSEEWERLATPKWRVKDVAGHLLDSNLRRLSIARDGYWGTAWLRHRACSAARRASWARRFMIEYPVECWK